MILNYSHCFSVTDSNQKANFDQSKIGATEDYNLITHGHSDHISITPQKIFTTKETSALINLSTQKTLDYEFVNGQTIDLTDNIQMQALNAGHILGSKMFYLESKNKSLLYTGDFRTQDSLLLSGAKPIETDILVLETTFGKKEFVFPEREKTYLDFAEKISKDINSGKLVLIGAYSLGKSQEIIKFVNEYLGETPIVTKKGFDYSKVYEDFDVFLGNYDLLDHNTDTHNILIVPMNLINADLIKSLEHQQNRKVASYLATGWNHYKSGRCIPISDHCDYHDLLEFVKATKAKKVFTMHGFADEFSKTISKELSIWSRPIKDLNQISIHDFL
ncbi:MAG: MBL fold metallo-hydrolase [archaeon]|jgi:Cft2 family RNA processing exonuclease